MDKCPLSGKECPHNKNIHVTEIKNGNVEEIHLCTECGNSLMDVDQLEDIKVVEEVKSVVEENTDVKMKNAFSGLLGSLFSLLNSASAQKNIEIKPKGVGKKPCPNCGITLEEIAKFGRIGCSECYKHFQTEMKIIAVHSHGATKHVGKIPKNTVAEQKKQKEIEENNADIKERIRSYKEKMTKAIKVENYEAAGDLKKLIEKLQSQLINDAEQPTPPCSEDQ